MTAHKPDQDDFDPALDEASDDFSYEEEAFGDEESVEGESWDENSDEGGDDSAEEESQTPARKKKKGGFFSMILILVAVLGGGAFIYLKVFSGVPTKPGPAVVANVPETSAQQGPSDTLAPPADPVIADAATTAEVPQNVVADEPLLPTPDDMTLVAVPEIAPEITPELAADPEMLAAELTPTEQQPVEVATAPPMPAPIAAPEESDGFAAGLPSANDIMLAPRPVVAVEATPAGLSDDAAKGIEEKLAVLISKMETFEGRITSLENGLHEISATAKKVPSADVDIKALGMSMAALEKKIGALEKGAVIQSSATPIEEPTFVPAPAAAPDDDTLIIEAADTVPAPVKKAPVWVLRSAQPGAAMIAAAAGGDMRSVKIGDNLSGLGRIVSIEQHGSRWVVQGTQGSLTN